MGNSNVKQHLDTAEKTGACQLSKSGLKEFPEDLSRLTKNLRTLDLSENKILQIPSTIGNYAQLKSFSMADNRLSSLPEEMGNLTKLETLNLERNSITALPNSFSKLKHLRNINLSGNRLLKFPSQLCGLTNLDLVDLSRNKITQISEDVRDLHTIELNLNQNQISSLPQSIADCPRLKVLRVEENCLEVTAFTPEIMRDSQIALLAVEGNVFDLKAFHNLEGYDDYMERFTATKKKFN